MTYKARIKFDNREWLVVDNIEYEGRKYFYIIEDISEQIENLQSIEEYEGNISIEFIYKVENNKYRNVTDEELITKLCSIVAIRAINSKE